MFEVNSYSTARARVLRRRREGWPLDKVDWAFMAIVILFLVSFGYAFRTVWLYVGAGGVGLLMACSMTYTWVNNRAKREAALAQAISTEILLEASAMRSFEDHTRSA